MKRFILQNLNFTALIAILFFQSCEKAEIFTNEANTGKIVEVGFTGSTSMPLEFLYNNIVVDTTLGENNVLPTKFLLDISIGNKEIQVREKGKTEILKTYQIDSSKYEQDFGLLLDEGQIYEKSINYNILALLMEGSMEIYLDGKLKLNQSGIIQQRITIPINNDQKRELTLKKEGTDNIIFKKIITSQEDADTLKFIFNGTDVIEKILLPEIKNPNSMSFTVLLETKTPGVIKNFNNDATVDFVFYLRDKLNGEVQKVVPELRIPISTKNVFTTFELPPPPDPTKYYYSFDIFRKGTNDVAFKANDNTFETFPNYGMYNAFEFVKNSKLIRRIGPYLEISENFDKYHLSFTFEDLSRFITIE